MPLLTQYPQFIARVEELGFMTLSRVLPGLPSLVEETPPSIWYTGDPQTDPWGWKDRAAAEKRLAYGCVIGGHKGFIAPRLYPLFYAACHPDALLDERWLAGELNQTIWQLWQLFEKKGGQDTSQVRKGMGVTASHGAGRVDSALRQLQREFYLTVTGSRRKIGKDGQPYGWAASTFAPVLGWVPPDWVSIPSSLDQPTAREEILALGQQMVGGVSRAGLAAALAW